MRNYNTYTLKVNVKYDKNVNRTIRIDGNCTFDDLSFIILCAFDFDDKHLYMFSMNQKIYDKDGYYHPDAEFGKNAAKTNLDSVKLKASDNFLFLYNFRDEWRFDISVLKIESGNVRTLTLVLDKTGKAVQHPKYSDRKLNEYNKNLCTCKYGENNGLNKEREVKFNISFKSSEKSMFELLSKQYHINLLVLVKALNIEPPISKIEISKAYSAEMLKELTLHKEKLLDILTPNAAKILIKIIQEDKKYLMSDTNLIKNLNILKHCGLIYVEENNGYIIYITEEAKEFAEFLSSRFIIYDIEERCKWDNYISAMMIVYGAIETKRLYELLCYYLGTDIDINILKRKILNQKKIWAEINLISSEFKNDNFISICDKEETKYILNNRNIYNIKEYKKFQLNEIAYIMSGNINIIVPGLFDLSSYLLMEKLMNEEDFTILATKISRSCMLGIKKEEILEFCRLQLNKNKIELNKKILEIIENIIKDHPCALLKGYSFREYSKIKVMDQGEIPFFDNDLPF